MSENDELMAQFAEKFSEIDPENPPRPELFGYSRVARSIGRVETAVTRMHQTVARNPNIPLPVEPENAYERWLKKHERDELSQLFADIFREQGVGTDPSMN